MIMMINFKRSFFKYALYLSAILLFPFFFAAAPALAQSEISSSSAYPVSVCDSGELVNDARNFYRQKDYLSVINRLESVFYIEKNLSAELKDMLTEALAKQIESELAKSDYKNAASYNIKILSLKENFDFVWLNKLLNIYMLSANYRKTHELCLEILKKQGLLALDNPSLAKIYGKLSVVYATFRDSAKSFDSLIEAALKDGDVKTIKSYAALIFPAHLDAKLLFDHAVALADKNMSKEAYIAAYIYTRSAEKPDARAEELLAALLKKDPSLKNIFTESATSSASAATSEVAAARDQRKNRTLVQTGRQRSRHGASARRRTVRKPKIRGCHRRI